MFEWMDSCLGALLKSVDQQSLETMTECFE